MLNIIERWKRIPNYSNYECSTLGHVRRIDTQRQLKPWLQNNGYLVVRVRGNDQIVKSWLVHRLVALTWLRKPLKYKVCVNHIDGNKQNNVVDNLEWVTNSENILHARRNGLNPYNKPTFGKKLGGHRAGTSKYFGVFWDKSRNKWKCAVRHNGKLIVQKRFAMEVEAARYYNRMLMKYGIADDHPHNIIKCPTTSRKA